MTLKEIQYGKIKIISPKDCFLSYVVYISEYTLDSIINLSSFIYKLWCGSFSYTNSNYKKMVDVFSYKPTTSELYVYLDRWVDPYFKVYYDLMFDYRLVFILTTNSVIGEIVRHEKHRKLVELKYITEEYIKSFVENPVKYLSLDDFSGSKEELLKFIYENY